MRKYRTCFNQHLNQETHAHSPIKFLPHEDDVTEENKTVN
jgi:hypothetical protein